jgi:hypothetical protein
MASLMALAIKSNLPLGELMTLQMTLRLWRGKSDRHDHWQK